MTYILGISAFYHDSAAALVKDGEIVAAAQEERFTRIKQDDSFPTHAIRYCLQEAGIKPSQLDAVGFYEKPIVKFHRLLETYFAYAPSGIHSFFKSMPLWLTLKLHIPAQIRKYLPNFEGPILFTDHHESHAASAFFPSPFSKAAILTIDGVGEWTTASLGKGEGNKVQLLEHIRFPHSLGLLYSAFTYYTGFKVNSGEYKVMGLAPYGDTKKAEEYLKLIYEHLIDLKPDGSFRMNMDYFDYCQGLTMTNERFHKLFGGAPRKPDQKMTQKEMDIALALQMVTEEAMLRMARYAKKVTGENNLCMAGGVALNCVGNGKIIREQIFDKYFFQPAAGDAGGALGTALFLWYQFLDKPRNPDGIHDFQKGSLLGPKFSNEEIVRFLKAVDANFKTYDDWESLLDDVVKLIMEEKVIGFFQDRMEYGPRALGSRSIIGDARSSKMQSIMNLKIKFRESFRPFAPIVMEEHAREYFDLKDPSPYMLRVGNVVPERRIQMTEEQQKLWGIEKLNIKRSDIPAITHVDYSARVQTVDKGRYPVAHHLLEKFKEKTQYAILVNTSFNVRGEPIVCTPQEAYRCFVNTNIDVLVLERQLLLKEEQKKVEQNKAYLDKFLRMDTIEDVQPHTFRSPKAIWKDPAESITDFGRVICIALFIIGLIFQWHAAGWELSWTKFLRNVHVPFIWWLAGGLTVTLSTLTPWLVRPVYFLWTMLGQSIGWVIQHLILIVIYYFVFTPVSVFYRRWCGMITKKPNSSMQTYWEKKILHTGKENYYQQF